MSTNTGYRQDMPPPGGYRNFNYARTFPKMVWRPGVVVAAVFGVTTFGLIDAIAKKKARITEKFEDVDINNAMQPFLTAERDRYWLKLLKKNRDLEEEVMKDVPGWKTGGRSSLLESAFLEQHVRVCLSSNSWLHERTTNYLQNHMFGFKGTWYGEPVYFTLGDKWWDPSQDEVFAHSDQHVLMKEILWRQHPEYSAPKFYDKWIPDVINKYIW